MNVNQSCTDLKIPQFVLFYGDEKRMSLLTYKKNKTPNRFSIISVIKMGVKNLLKKNMEKSKQSSNNTFTKQGNNESQRLKPLKKKVYQNIYTDLVLNCKEISEVHRLLTENYEYCGENIPLNFKHTFVNAIYLIFIRKYLIDFSDYNPENYYLTVSKYLEGDEDSKKIIENNVERCIKELHSAETKPTEIVKPQTISEENKSITEIDEYLASIIKLFDSIDFDENKSTEIVKPQTISEENKSITEIDEYLASIIKLFDSIDFDETKSTLDVERMSKVENYLQSVNEFMEFEKYLVQTKHNKLIVDQFERVIFDILKINEEKTGSFEISLLIDEFDNWQYKTNILNLIIPNIPENSKIRLFLMQNVQFCDDGESIFDKLKLFAIEYSNLLCRFLNEDESKSFKDSEENYSENDNLIKKLIGRFNENCKDNDVIKYEWK
ncbi:hypothetical protein MHBO_001336 [Bonamia ostreae]|uniref:Uncharacterized protein n=1 Tax=Bonamia ostreae TaxID=126728 RepID=A0ABV2AIL4_9EUKA